MRRKSSGLVTVRAISGTHVVFLAFGMIESDAKGLMGFAIQRTDLTDDETIWLRGNKTFASIRPSTGIEDASSHKHPFQAFQWADYSAKPGYRYRYRVIPMYGKAGALTQRAATRITIATEPLSGERHDVHFNRLRAAIYELKWPQVLAAFKDAARAGADVKILYHAKADDTGTENDQQIDDAHIRSLCVPRKNAKLMHNKFIVISKAGKPIAVWTGSTNLSRNALHGQLNVGHVFHDRTLAKRFLGYWTALQADPAASDLKDWAEAENALPPTDDTDTLTPVFSPHRGRSVFDWWIDLAKAPAKPLFMTFPFGIVKDFRPVFDQRDGVLRFGLLDKYVNGGTKESRAAAIADIERIRRHPNVGMALGKRIFVDWIDGWHMESNPLGVNVNWVHTKFMLVDPLGAKPMTLTGSANWSEASIDTNDENMVVIRGDKRVADIYFGEFMRTFAHHRFRESVARHIAQFGSAAFNT